MTIRNLQHLFEIQEEHALELDRVVDTINHYRGLRFPKEDTNQPGPSTVQSLPVIKDSPELKSNMKLAPIRPEYVMSIKHPNNEARCERCNFPTPVLSFLVSHMKNHQGESPPYIRFPKDSLYFCQPKSENGQPIYTTTIRVPVECVGFFMGPNGTKKESLKGSLKDFQVDLWQFNMLLFEWKSKFLREVIPRPYPEDCPFGYGSRCDCSSSEVMFTVPDNSSYYVYL
ncbi:unnamed protein product [Allacma fusca]|uniref:C2H2-type domain-containing protein n=1 Tax=Allacma fusca TaxID=39272 RepID=A0A8J2K335_9HEXA|nr:unnamed protein product [Allacma fusca]